MISNILAERLGELELNNSEARRISMLQQRQAGLRVSSEGLNKGSRFSFIVVNQRPPA
jgi:hypothetical protein